MRIFNHSRIQIALSLILFVLIVAAIVTTQNPVSILILLPLAYAEIHYRLPFLFNFLNHREPEIIADVPYRIGPQKALPLLLLIKDAHQYPVVLQRLSVFIDELLLTTIDLNQSINEPFWERIFHLNVEKIPRGDRNINVKIVYSIKGREKICFNDNYRGSSHQPLPCHFARENLPLPENFLCGDLHSHSSYTNDQIEFGAGLETMREMAYALELDFFAVTDHSYDLDDAQDNYLKNDPTLPKWRDFLARSKRLNQEPERKPVIITGEEVSSRNARNQNVHLLVLNQKTFIPGSGDSGEKWFNRKSEHSIQEIKTMARFEALLVPAHPAEKVPLMQQLFLKRGYWQQKDLKPFRFLQAINGGPLKTAQRGVDLWRRMLLQGQKVILLAGNDAHGHFARTREIKIPFVQIGENDGHLFGEWKTVVHCETTAAIIEQLKTGQIFITNGPFLWLKAHSRGQWFEVGATLSQFPEQVEVVAQSTQEFGAISYIQVIGGAPKEGKEHVLWEQTFDRQAAFEFQQKISLPRRARIAYIRALVFSQDQTKKFMALTNCIWID